MNMDEKGKFVQKYGFIISLGFPSFERIIDWIALLVLLMPWIVIILRQNFLEALIKVFDKTSQCGFCVKKDYINDKLSEIQGFCLDFNNSQIIDIDEEQCKQVEEIYCENNNELYQISIKEFNNRDYGKLLYENIRNNFLVIKKDEVLER